ncbi:MAG: hypothetical protein Q4E73_01370 [Lachnospiraceae bacterium]|nr:hypothetical protein [Lachnospiraceae bacterium]
MAKPVYYLWKSDFQNEDALSKEKKKYTDFGFRVVIYQDAQSEKNIHDGLKALIKNHYPINHD